MNILFINGSPNQNGNTAALASELLKGKEYETLNLTDYRIGSYGQNLEDDGLGQVIAKIKQAEIIVIGSPLYWHYICGSVRLSAKYAGSFLRLGRERFIVGQNALLPLSRCGAGKMDAGRRRIYNETFCGTLRNEVCRYGNQSFRSG